MWNMFDSRTEAVRAANHWFQTRQGSAVYDTFQAEYLATTRQVFLEVALHKLARPPRRILDVGCGGGEGLAYLSKRLPDAELHGIDPEAAMLDRAHELIGERCHLQQASLLEYDASRRTFDLIVSYSTFRFWNRPAACLTRAYALLSPTGLGYMADIRRDVDENVQRELMSRMLSDDHRTFLASQMESAYRVGEVRLILEEAGMDPSALHVGGLAGFGPRSREAFELLQKNERLAEIIFGLQRAGFQSDRGHESVFYITITSGKDETQ